MRVVVCGEMEREVTEKGDVLASLSRYDFGDPKNTIGRRYDVTLKAIVHVIDIGRDGEVPGLASK